MPVLSEEIRIPDPSVHLCPGYQDIFLYPSKLRYSCDARSCFQINNCTYSSVAPSYPMSRFYHRSEYSHGRYHSSKYSYGRKCLNKTFSYLHPKDVGSLLKTLTTILFSRGKPRPPIFPTETPAFSISEIRHSSIN